MSKTAVDRAAKLTDLARREAEDLADVGALLVIESPEQYESAGEALRQIKTRIAELEDKRKEITRPLDASKKAVMDLFRVPLERFKAIETSIKAAMTSHLEAVERERQRALEALAEANPDDARAIVGAISEPAPEAAGIQTRVSWQYEITDAEALPREFLIPDVAKLRAHVRAHEDRTKIPGVRVFQKTTIAASKA